MTGGTVSTVIGELAFDYKGGVLNPDYVWYVRLDVKHAGIPTH